MRTFTLFMADKRYGVPTLDIIHAPSAVRAAEFAQRRLGESPHHLAIELCEDDEPIARLGPSGVVWLIGPSG